MKKKENKENMKKYYKRFVIGFLIWITIFSLGMVRKTFQNDTFYTIKIGKLILDNGIDMMDHFSFHTNLAYSYPHWLYDVFIYLVYDFGGWTGLYISSIVLLIILLFMVFKTNKLISENYSVAAFATFICALAVSGFATARAQLVSFIVFAAQIYFIEKFLRSGKKINLLGLILLSLILCNIHVAVWPFYFIVYLPYLAEYLISWIAEKIKFKKETKFLAFLKKKFILEKNKNIKWLLITMVVSLITGLFTPIGDTPYTYLIKTMLGNSQNYIQEHQMLSWIDSPFTIIIAFETIFLSFFSKVKLRDLFMILGLVFMSVMSTRHLSLLALLGTICFSRIFKYFLENFNFNVDDAIIKLFNKKVMAIVSFSFVIILSGILVFVQSRKEFIDHEKYPIEAVKFIKENLDVDKIHIFNEYDFGSYLLMNDIPVFIDSRADLYTKQFSGFDYDIFDDYAFIIENYPEKFEFYDITHVLIYKGENNDNALYVSLKDNKRFKMLYEDDYFILFERLDKDGLVISYS